MINYRNQILEKCCSKCHHSIENNTCMGSTTYCMYGDIHEDVSDNGICDVFIFKKEYWERCPDCDNSGVIAIGDNEHGWEPCQCEFCYTNEKSIFYNEQKLGQKEG